MRSPLLASTSDNSPTTIAWTITMRSTGQQTRLQTNDLIALRYDVRVPCERRSLTFPPAATAPRAERSESTMTTPGQCRKRKMVTSANAMAGRKRDDSHITATIGTPRAVLITEEGRQHKEALRYDLHMPCERQLLTLPAAATARRAKRSTSAAQTQESHSHISAGMGEHATSSVQHDHQGHSAPP